MDEERAAWDRLENEAPKEYAAFRLFRDQGPLRKLKDVHMIGVTDRTVRQWSYDNNWWPRAAAWDDHNWMEADRQRLEEIRTMHGLHQQAGRAALNLAITALENADPSELPAYVAARLLELGAKLERDTLTISVEELQGINRATPGDPWEAIAHELTTPAE